MAKIKNLLKFSDPEEREILRHLHQMETERTPVRVEIEGENIHFFSVFSIKKNLVVLAKPPGLRRGLKRDSAVRFKIPQVNKTVRMEVTVSHFNLLNGGYVFLCGIPKKYSEASKRGSDRFNTSRFNNLHLVIPAAQQRFRIIDMSAEGCKVFSRQTRLGDLFEVGKQIYPAQITVGEKVEIDLEWVVARDLNGSTVGFQILPTQAGSSARYLSHFIKSLETAEINNLKVEER